jgi:hypothetical protein
MPIWGIKKNKKTLHLNMKALTKHTFKVRNNKDIHFVEAEVGYPHTPPDTPHCLSLV